MEERFKTFSTDENVSECRKEAVPKNTRKHTSWGVNGYTKWARTRNEAMKDFSPENAQYPEAPEDLSSLRIDEINYWLSKFCVDARQKNGEEYRHEVLYSLFCAINRVIRESHPDVVLLKSPQLKPLQDVLDSRLKELQSKQTPFRKKAKALSGKDEEKLWCTGSLGTHSPRVLVDTLIFLAGKIFALRGGQEHRSLSFDSFEFAQTDDGKTIVTYRRRHRRQTKEGLNEENLCRKWSSILKTGAMKDRLLTYLISTCQNGNFIAFVRFISFNVINILLKAKSEFFCFLKPNRL